MPNWTDTVIRVIGKPHNLRIFQKHIHTGGGSISVGKILLFDANIEDKGDRLIINGGCRWSISPLIEKEGRNVEENCYPTLKELAKKLNLDILVNSEESGMVFQEVYWTDGENEFHRSESYDAEEDDDGNCISFKGGLLGPWSREYTGPGKASDLATIEKEYII